MDGPTKKDRLATVFSLGSHAASPPLQGAGTLTVASKYETAEPRDMALPSSVAPPPGNVTPELAMMVPSMLEPMGFASLHPSYACSFRSFPIFFAIPRKGRSKNRGANEILDQQRSISQQMPARRYAFLLATATKPIKPEPNSHTAAGMGTGVVDMEPVK